MDPEHAQPDNAIAEPSLTSPRRTAARSVPLDDHDDLVDGWRDARATAGRARDEVDRIEQQLYALLGDAELGTLNGEPAVVRQVEKRQGIDLARLRFEQPDLLRQYPRTRVRVRLKFPRRYHLDSDR